MSVDDPLAKVADFSAQQVELLTKLLDAQKRESPWLKTISAIGPILSALLIAMVGWYFTSIYNQQQVRLSQIEAIEKLSPKLTDGTDEQRLTALAAVLSLDSENLAIRTVAAISPQTRTHLLSQLFASSIASRDYELMNRILKVIPPGGIDVDASGRTPVQIASASGDLQTTAFLIDKGFDVDAPGSSRTTALIEAARRGDSVTARLLLRRGANAKALDQSGRTPLLVAIDRGHADIVRTLLSYGSDVHFRDSEGHDALIAAVGFNGTRYPTGDFPAGEIVEALLAAGADPNSTKKPYGQTAICEAAELGLTDAVKALFKAGARFTCGLGLSSPLSTAAFRNRPEIVKYFLSKGISANYREESGFVPLHEVREPEVTSLLIEAGADVNARTDRGLTPLGSVLHEPIFQGMTAEQRRDAMHEYEKSILRTVQILIKAGADANRTSEYGHLPLELAAARYGPEVLDVLLKAGANVNALSGTEVPQTALMQAAGNCRWDDVEYLLHNKANPYLRDQTGKAAFDKAVESIDTRRKFGPIESSDFGTVEDCYKTISVLRINSGVAHP